MTTNNSIGSRDLPFRQRAIGKRGRLGPYHQDTIRHFGAGAAAFHYCSGDDGRDFYVPQVAFGKRPLNLCVPARAASINTVILSGQGRDHDRDQSSRIEQSLFIPICISLELACDKECKYLSAFGR